MGEMDKRGVTEDRFKSTLAGLIDENPEKLPFYDRFSENPTGKSADDFKDDAGRTSVPNMKAAGKRPGTGGIGTAAGTGSGRPWKPPGLRRWRGAAVAIACCIVLVPAMLFVSTYGRKIPEGLLEKGRGGNEDVKVETEYAETAVNAVGYENIYEAVKKMYDADGSYGYVSDVVGVAESGSDTRGQASADGSPSSESPGASLGSGGEAAANDYSSPVYTGGSDYSDTNIQVEGVQEADIVKTDGKYIYTANSQYLSITAANDGDVELLSKYDISAIEPVSNQDAEKRDFYAEGEKAPASAAYYREMFLDGNLISLVRDFYGDDGTMATEVYVMDVSDPASPQLIHTFSQSGGYTDSRMIDGKLYLISEYNPKYRHGWDDPADPASFVPNYRESGGDIQVAEASDIVIIKDSELQEYVVVSGIDARQGKFISQKSVMGSRPLVYMSESAIYLAASDYYNEEGSEGRYLVNRGGVRTVLTRIGVREGKVTVGNTATVPGEVRDRYGMDEKDGGLRLVTLKNEYMSVSVDMERDSLGKLRSGLGAIGPDSISKSVNETALFILDSDLNTLGYVDDIAPGEDLKSVRFMGDMAYVVTFRYADPLFSMDLSDPKNPKVAGQLDIPGFSTYMHPYDDGLLFGIGYDADEQTGIQESLKLSMYDNSDPKNVTETSKTVIDGYTYSEAAENPRAILVSGERDIIAFPAGGDYLIYSYDRETGGFSREAVIRLSAGSGTQEYLNEFRGLFIDDCFFVISANSLAGFDMGKGFERTGDVSIGEGAISLTKQEYAWAQPVYAMNAEDGAL
ncbi:MAG: beta-propeller domain-containing protein, partial [Clostridiales Family XIII bacterium]|nr:beta-propeller domain-containing protein [Clostridiales Family XIII bacterium]